MTYPGNTADCPSDSIQMISTCHMRARMVRLIKINTNPDGAVSKRTTRHQTKSNKEREGCKLFGAKTLNSTSLASQSTQALVSSGILNLAVRQGREIHRKSCLLSGGGRAILRAFLPANSSWIRGWSSRRGV